MAAGGTAPPPSETSRPVAEIRRIVLRYAGLAVLGWSVLVAASLAYNLDKQRALTFELARNTADANFNKDVAYRLWASSHGGVYVTPTEKTPPSPWMSHIPDRDLTTTDGRLLTLMNPAYMLREMMQDYGELYGIKGRIVGIVALNANNLADAWEAEAIRQFSDGRLAEKLEIAEIDGAPFMRLFKPFRMEESCQKCHGHLGFKTGEVRGGIGVSVPLAPYLASEHRATQAISATHALLWALGLTGIVWFARRSHRRLVAASAMTEALRLKNEALLRSNAELEAFAYVASHDLREPLRNITAFSTILARALDGRLSEEERGHLGILTDAATRMDALVRDLLEVSRVGRSELAMEPVDLGAVLTTALDSLRIQIQAAEATVEVADPLPTVRGNGSELYRVFVNLIGNALKYRRGPGGRITVACAAEGEGAWRIEVRDDGIGIEPGHGYEERIFGLFQRLHQRHEYGGGTGIGLPVCRKIVNRHGGRIWAESAGLDKGTTIVMILPAGGEA